MLATQRLQRLINYDAGVAGSNQFMRHNTQIAVDLAAPVSYSGRNGLGPLKIACAAPKVKRIP